MTLSWIWNEVKVKMKGMLHIYNDCTIDWHQVWGNMWSGLGWVAHTKYHTSFIKYAEKTKFFVTLSWIWNKVKVKMKGMLHIYNYCTIDWYQVCANMWSGVTHTKYHPYSDGWIDGHTDTRTWILCPPFGAFSPWGTTSLFKQLIKCTIVFLYNTCILLQTTSPTHL